MAHQSDKYPTVELLSDKIDEYIVHCREVKKKITTAGLAAYLGYANKCSLRDLAKRDKEYALVIGRFKLMLEDEAVQGLLKPGQPTTGYIFNLKNNFGYDSDGAWVDRQEVDSKGGPVIQVISAIDRDEKEQEEDGA